MNEALNIPGVISEEVSAVLLKKVLNDILKKMQKKSSRIKCNC